jgi:hypothetical protein
VDGEAGTPPDIIKVIEPPLTEDGRHVMSQCVSWSAIVTAESVFVCSVQESVDVEVSNELTPVTTDSAYPVTTFNAHEPLNRPAGNWEGGV